MQSAAILTLCLSFLGQALAGHLSKHQVNVLATCPDTGTSIGIGYNVTQVMGVAATAAQHSFEFGTYSQALLELYNPELTVFDASPFPEGKIPAVLANISSLTAAVPHIQLHSDLLAPDADGHPSNPATLGIAAIQLGQSNASYMDAATAQANYLLTAVPRLPSGAISTSDSDQELWAEWLWQAPPFLAYYAVATNNATLLNETINQIGLYRDVLRNNSGPASHWWLHVSANNSDADLRPWSSGNAYVVAGLARVLATTVHWGPTASWTSEQTNLKTWIREITDAVKDNALIGAVSPAVARVAQDDQGLIPNYLAGTGVDRTVGTFGEVTGTALMGSAIYRLLVLAPDWFEADYESYAGQLRSAIANHWFSNGVLSPSVMPYDAESTVPYTAGSAQAQSAGGLLYAAYRDCVCAGICAKD